MTVTAISPVSQSYSQPTQIANPITSASQTAAATQASATQTSPTQQSGAVHHHHHHHGGGSSQSDIGQTGTNAIDPANLLNILA